MDISRHYTSSAQVQREGFVGASTVKKAFVTHIASVSCMLQPYTSEATEVMSGAFGKQYIMFCANQDIAEGDKVIIDGKTYGVAGVESYFMGRNPHMEVTLTTFSQ